MLGKPSYASTLHKPQRLQALLAACLLEVAPQGLSFPSCKMEGVMLAPSSASEGKSSRKSWQGQELPSALLALGESGDGC